MSRTHPPSLTTLARRALTGEIALPRGARVLVAVSGGPDSTALLHVLAELRAPLGFELAAHGVDHGLRAEAGLELARAAELATVLGVAFGTSRVDVARGGNLQARARDARRAALLDASARAGASFIATAHHADDRAETVLMRLLRGAPPSGLAVLAPRADPFIRPFIRARRPEIAAHLERHGVASSHDPSNDDPRFLRVRVRRELIPLLEALSPTIATHLCALADALPRAEAPGFRLPRATHEALLALARTRSPSARVALPGGLVAQLPDDFRGARRSGRRAQVARSDPE